MSHRRTVVSSLLVLLAAPAAGQTTLVTMHGAGPVPAAEVAAIRAATQKYRDVNVAIAEGYIAHPVCMVAANEGAPRQLGGMGVHYFRPDLLGITGTEPRVDGNGTHTDFMQPSILVYEPQSDGSMQLLAIENLVWEKAWREAGHTQPPDFHGYEYYHIVDNPATPDVDEAHGFQPHYELHWWMYRDNPNGTFSPFNPAMSCEFSKPAEHMHG